MIYACGDCGRFLKQNEHKATKQERDELGYPEIYYTLTCKMHGLQVYPETVNLPRKRKKEASKWCT